MKKKIMVLSMVIQLMGISVFAQDKEITVSVKGMVCSFCAQGIKKKFSAEEAVNQVDVNLTNHLVKLTLKEGKDISNEKVSTLLQ